MYFFELNLLNFLGKFFFRGIGIFRKLLIMFFKEVFSGERVRKFEIFVMMVIVRGV